MAVRPHNDVNVLITDLYPSNTVMMVNSSCIFYCNFKNILGLELVSALAWGTVGLGGSLGRCLLVAGGLVAHAACGTHRGKESRAGGQQTESAPADTPVMVSLILPRPHVTSLLLLNGCQREGRDLRPCSSEAKLEARRDN